MYEIYRLIYVYNTSRIHSALKMPPQTFALRYQVEQFLSQNPCPTKGGLDTPVILMIAAPDQFVTKEEHEEQMKRMQKQRETEKENRENKADIPKEKKSGGHEPEAYICAKQYIKQNLKAPSTAKFPFSPPAVSHVKDDTYVIRVYVDAQNSFGAMIRTDFICEVIVRDARKLNCGVSCSTL